MYHLFWILPAWAVLGTCLFILVMAWRGMLRERLAGRSAKGYPLFIGLLALVCAVIIICTVLALC